MSKRVATYELNADNWDQELEKEEIGEFTKADQDTISKRKILSVRRSNTTEVKQTGLFKSFTGFSNLTSKDNNFSKFSFNLNSNTANSTYPKEYIDRLADLNSSLLEWIKKNLEKDKSCIFSPVFDDYLVHLKSLNQKFNVDPLNSNIGTKTTSLVSENNVVPAESTGLFSMKPAINLESKTKVAKPLFSFQPVNPKPDATNVNQLDNKGEDEDEEYVPPEPEDNKFEESGSVYTTKCKIYYKLADSWKERGLGNLFIIPPEGSKDKASKFQLIVRTDTNLGNILLNVNITSSIPFSASKNNLSILTVPNPSIPEIKDETKPVPMLIRVKTQDGAKELEEKFKQYTSLESL